LKFSESHAGKKGTCKCGAAVPIPRSAVTVHVSAAAAAPARPARSSAARKAGRPTAVAASPAKVCVTCGADLAGAKRMKDEGGNYFCQACWGVDKSRGTPAAEAAEPDRVADPDYNPLDDPHAHVVAEAPATAAPAKGRKPTRVAPLYSETVLAPEAAGMLQCAACGAIYAADRLKEMPDKTYLCLDCVAGRESAARIAGAANPHAPGSRKGKQWEDAPAGAKPGGGMNPWAHVAIGAAICIGGIIATIVSGKSAATDGSLAAARTYACYGAILGGAVLASRGLYTALRQR